MASHLTLKEREIIARMHWDGKMQTQIADRLCRDKSTISANCNAIVAATDTGRDRPTERPNGAGASGRGSARCSGQKCVATSRIVCGGDGRPTRSRPLARDFPRDQRRWISPQRSTPGSSSRKPPENTDGANLRRLGRKRPEWENGGRIRAGTSIAGRPAVR